MLGKLNSQHTYKSYLSRQHIQHLNVVWNLNNSMNNHKASCFSALWILAHEKPICSYWKQWRSISSWDWLCRSRLGSAAWKLHFESPTRAATCRPPQPIPSWLQKRARGMFSPGKSKHYMVDCSLGEDNVWLPAVKPQTAPAQIWFGD